MRILFVHGTFSTFTRMDLQILSEVHTVRPVQVRRDSMRAIVTSLLDLVRGAAWAETVFVWFASVHALLAFLPAAVFARRRIVVAGGYDVAAAPEIDYGNMRPGVKRLIGLAAFRLAERVLAFSQHAAKEARQNAGVNPDRIEVIHLGLPAEGYPVRLPEPARTVVLTVGGVNRSNLTRKGLTTFVEAAKRLPTIPFVLIGRWEDDAVEDLRKEAPPNLTITGAVTDEELADWMRKAKVYVQVSAHEGFGLALAEAMLLGCVPVVTDRGSLPEVVGDTGEYVPFGDIQLTAEAIRRAFDSPPDAGARARARILTRYSLEDRRRRLLAAVAGENPTLDSDRAYASAR